MDIKKIIDLHERLYNLNTEKWLENYNKWDYILKELKSECDEALEELKSGNKEALEYEVWDILYDLVWALVKMKNNWEISSIEEILNKCDKKFSQRVDLMEEWKSWEEIKKMQKENWIY